MLPDIDMMLEIEKWAVLVKRLIGFLGSMKFGWHKG